MPKHKFLKALKLICTCSQVSQPLILACYELAEWYYCLLSEKERRGGREGGRKEEKKEEERGKEGGEKKEGKEKLKEKEKKEKKRMTEKEMLV